MANPKTNKESTRRQDDFSRQLEATRSRLNWSTRWYPLILLILLFSLIAIGVIGLPKLRELIPIKEPFTFPTLTPAETTQAQLSFSAPELTEAGTVVSRTLTISNLSQTSSLWLEVEGEEKGYVKLQVVLPTIQAEQTENRFALGEFQPNESKHYQMLIYRHAPAFSVEPQLTLRLTTKEDLLLDQWALSPLPHQLTATLEITTSSGVAILQPGEKLEILAQSNVAGRYILQARDEEGNVIQCEKEELELEAELPSKISCPFGNQKPGQWRFNLYPQTTPDSPSASSEEPLVTQSFQIEQARPEIEITQEGAFASSSGENLAEITYQLSNTGNLTQRMALSYHPVSLAGTLLIEIPQLESAVPYTQEVNADIPTPLLPGEHYLAPGENIRIKAIIEYSDPDFDPTTLKFSVPLEFNLRFLDWRNQELLYEQPERIESLQQQAQPQ